MLKAKKYLAVSLLAATSAAVLSQAGTSYISKPAIAQTARAKVLDLNTKKGATCFVHRDGPAPVNITEGILKAASDNWIVVTPKVDKQPVKDFETWIPMHKVQQIEFPPAR